MSDQESKQTTLTDRLERQAKAISHLGGRIEEVVGYLNIEPTSRDAKQEGEPVTLAGRLLCAVDEHTSCIDFWADEADRIIVELQRL